ncbi:type II toxin-antitoxin system VapC family toxin [Planctomycetota bacterium]
MKYLLDTCAISELVKRKPSKKVLEWLQGIDEDTIYLSVLTIGEIQKGIAKLADSKRKTDIQQWLDNDLHDRFSGRIIPITEEVASTWGIIVAQTEIRGELIPSIDSLIGATAVAHNLTVVTRNIEDILGTGARVLNPWEL